MHCQKSSNISHNRVRRHCKSVADFYLRSSNKEKAHDQRKFLHKSTSFLSLLPVLLWWCYHSCTFLCKSVKKSCNFSGRLQDLCCMHIKKELLNPCPCACCRKLHISLHSASPLRCSQEGQEHICHICRAVQEDGSCLPRTEIYCCHLT